MSKPNRQVKELKKCIFDIRKDKSKHQAGANRLTITRKSEDVYFDNAMVSMTIQEAKALKTFLDKNLK